VRFRLIPRDEGFYPIFNDAAENAAACAELLHLLLLDLTRAADLNAEIVELERRGDELTRAIITRLDTAIITPFDREDIHALTEQLDNAVDDMRAAADLVLLHTVVNSKPGAPELADHIEQAARKMVELFVKLPRLRDMKPELDAIDAIESEGDQCYRTAVAHLFSGEYKAFEVLRWKDILEAMEHSLNSLERTSDIVATIQLKHA
jgi:predicted phosphate transport protein (TIGR00153 family)